MPRSRTGEPLGQSRSSNTRRAGTLRLEPSTRALGSPTRGSSAGSRHRASAKSPGACGRRPPQPDAWGLRQERQSRRPAASDLVDPRPYTRDSIRRCSRTTRCSARAAGPAATTHRRSPSAEADRAPRSVWPAGDVHEGRCPGDGREHGAPRDHAALEPHEPGRSAPADLMAWPDGNDILMSQQHSSVPSLPGLPPSVRL